MEKTTEYTIRENDGGCIVCRGYYAESPAEALDDFIEDHPGYEAKDFYAAESQWND